MPERSTSFRGLRAAGLLLAVLLAAAAPARAQGGSGSVGVPPGAPVVAGPTASGTSAVAFLHGKELCMAFVQQGAPASGQQEGDCVAVPVLQAFGHRAISLHGTAGGGYQEIGVTGGAAAFISYKLAGATVARAATQPSPLPGAAGTLRFYAIETPAGARSDELALLDTFEAVQRAYALDGFFDAGPPVPRDPPGRILAQGRRGSGRWTLRTRIAHPLAPTPLLPERRVAGACVTLATALRRPADGVCDLQARAAEPVLFGLTQSCSPVGTALTVLARAAVRRVEVVLGDGRRRAVALRAIPDAPAGERAGVAVLGRGIAVRALVATGSGGRTLLRRPLGLPPAVRFAGCEEGLDTAIIRYAVGLSQRPLGAGPHAPHVATDGVRLCLAIDRAPRPPGGCAVPPLDAEDVFLTTEPTADGRYVAGFVPREVARVRLRLDDGRAREVRPAPVDGPYAVSVALVAADVPGAHPVVGYDLLDAAGGTLASSEGPQEPAFVHRTVLLAHPGPGLGPLIAARRPRVGRVGPTTCAALVGLIGEDRCELGSSGIFRVIVRCAPRQIVVIGTLDRAGQRIAVRTAAGREIRGRTVALPAALRSTAPRAVTQVAVALAVLPASAAPRKLLLRGPDASTTTLALPAAREQCGYQSYAYPGEDDR